MSRAAQIVVLVLMLLGGSAVLAGPGGLLRGGSSSASAGLLATAVVTRAPGGDATPAQADVTGDMLDCPPPGAGPEDVRSRFGRNGAGFNVTGVLKSFDAITIVISGPSGDVSATLAPSFELKGALTPGQPVRASGNVADDGSMTVSQAESACAGSGTVTCVGGGNPRLRLKLEGGVFELTGTLDSLSETTMFVSGPGLLVEVGVNSTTSIQSGLKHGDPVTVNGIVQDPRALLGQKVISACGADVGAAVAAKPAQPKDSVDHAAVERCNRGPGHGGKLRTDAKRGEDSLQEDNSVLADDVKVQCSKDTAGDDDGGEEHGKHRQGHQNAGQDHNENGDEGDGSD